MTKKIPIDLFPLSVAAGLAFCNRVNETAKLKLCIEHSRPVLIVSPRRYGKTSLALNAIRQSKLPFAHIDFFSAIDEQDIARIILNGISKLLSSIETIPQKAFQLASRIFEGSHVRAVLSNIGLSIEVNNKQERPSQHILDVLERLEKLAVKSNKKIILFFDEFQCIGELAPDHSMESVLRQIAQLTKSISFIFSGSNRHLLNQLFEDRNRPFYKLCERITLDRISEQDYEKQIRLATEKLWDTDLTALDQETVQALFHYSERHPYYVNLICSRMLLEKQKPNKNAIQNIWIQYLAEERSHVARELDLLSKNQKKLLTILARTDGVSSALGADFIQIAKMSKTSIDQALCFLERRDYVMRDHNGIIKVLDPLIRAVLAV